MEKRELPPDFDWVTARSECSVVKFFERLRLQAERDVKTRNDLRTTSDKQDGLKFGFVSSGNSFSAFHDGKPGIAVRFRLEGDVIEVEGQGVDGVALAGTVTLTDQARCRLRLEGTKQELDEWQVLRRALEPLLFPA